VSDEQPQEEQPDFDRDALLNPEPNSIDLLNREARERAGAEAPEAEAEAEPEAETSA
jgi:hypothetical protein